MLENKKIKSKVHNQKVISFVIPSFNSNELLLKCLMSFDDLLLSNEIDFIVIDDNSNINQMNFIKTINIKNIKFIRNDTNMGLPFSRNIGIEQSNARYIAFVDSDDTIISHELRKVIDYISCDENETDLFRVGIIKNNVVLKPQNYSFKNLSEYLINVYITDKFTVINSVTHIYRRDFLINKKFSKERIYSEDLLHFFMCAEVTNIIETIPIAYYVHNQNNINSITKTKKKEMSMDQYKIYSFMKENIKNKLLIFIGCTFYFFFYKKNMCGKKIKGMLFLYISSFPVVTLKYLSNIWKRIWKKY